MIDSRAIHRLISSAQVGKEDTVLEIGPGIGTLTKELAQKAKKVIAIEKDQKMVEILRETLSGFSNVEIIHEDALNSNYKLPTTSLREVSRRETNYKLVANLPYYIAAPVIRKFLELSKAKPYSMTLIIQKEVAQRICGKPPKMSILAVSVQVYAAPKIISYIKKTSFWPQPKVDAAILQVTPFPTPYALDPHRFFRIVKAGFKQPRKQLRSNLSKELDLARQTVEKWLIKNNISPTQRAETLTVQNWIVLTNSL